MGGIGSSMEDDNSTKSTEDTKIVSSEDTTKKSDTKQVEEQTVEPVQTEEPTVKPTDKPKKTPKPTKAPKIGEISAMEKAQAYIAMGGFSKKGLKEQLKFEGFTTEQCNYAVKKVGY